MFTRVYAKHPCTQSFRSQGLAVGRVRPYPLLTHSIRGGPFDADSAKKIFLKN
jgi:hypothetical protein